MPSLHVAVAALDAAVTQHNEGMVRRQPQQPGVRGNVHTVMSAESRVLFTWPIESIPTQIARTLPVTELLNTLLNAPPPAVATSTLVPTDTTSDDVGVAADDK